MKKIFVFLLLIIVVASCIDRSKIRKTHNMPLRQMVQVEKSTYVEQASFFLLSGSYDKYKIEEQRIKVFASDNGIYKYIDIPFDKIGITIDNTVEVPYMYILYRDLRDMGSNDVRVNQLLDNYFKFDVENYVVVCPEKYLPSKLLPIEIK